LFFTYFQGKFLSYVYALIVLLRGFFPFFVLELYHKIAMVQRNKEDCRRQKDYGEYLKDVAFHKVSRRKQHWCTAERVDRHYINIFALPSVVFVAANGKSRKLSNKHYGECNYNAID
jgi:hypothetical protein